MLEQIMDLVKQHAGDAIINNSAIPNEHNEAAIATTSNSIMESIQNVISGGGGMGAIQELISGGGLQSHVAASLQDKLGIDSNAAGGVAGSIVPNVLQGIMSKFEGGGLGGMLGNLTGKLDTNHDGKTDAGDLGGLADGLKGLFK